MKENGKYKKFFHIIGPISVRFLLSVIKCSVIVVLRGIFNVQETLTWQKLESFFFGKYLLALEKWVRKFYSIEQVV